MFVQRIIVGRVEIEIFGSNEQLLFVYLQSRKNVSRI